MSLIATPVRSRTSVAVQQGGRGVNGLRLAVSRRVYLPAFSIVVVALVLVAIGWVNRWGGADFAGARVPGFL